MSYLLDSHTFIWAILDRKSYQRRYPVLEDGTNRVFISSVSFWELSLKHRLGKLVLTGFSPDELPVLAQESGFEFLPLTHDLTLLSKDKTVSLSICRIKAAMVSGLHVISFVRY